MKKIFLVLTLLVSGFSFTETYIACRMDAKTFNKEIQKNLERFPPAFFHLFIVVYGDNKLGEVSVQMDNYIARGSTQSNISSEKGALYGKFSEDYLVFDGRFVNRKTLAYSRHMSKQKGQCEILKESAFWNQRKKSRTKSFITFNRLTSISLD